MNLLFKSSQQSSQEESVPRFITNYHTKPLLLGDVNDEKSIYGILDKFEEDRKKVEEKKNSDFLAKELQHVRETLVKMADTEKTFSSTLQNSLKSLQDDISQKFDTLVDKVNSHEEMMAALQERVQVMNNNGGTTADLDSHFKSLESGLEHLKEDQGRQNHGLEEALKHLSASLSEHSKRRSAEGLMDSAIQTSPGLSNFLQARQLEVAPRTHPSYNLQQHQKASSGFRCVLRIIVVLEKGTTTKGKK
ncbi:interactor of HORMAD1 protein 1 [Cololabis saira]|uniref:interactor of HORMAD1 protein 1 n=1 Tax=Cololabis saira TaxID=129043 RepID=UPI002AD505C5|nr:interactor of HORMAD1 protein 1 [Cololabis saira]